jgi:hypothetical protein
MKWYDSRYSVHSDGKSANPRRDLGGANGLRGKPQVAVLRPVVRRRMTFRRSRSVCDGLAWQGGEIQESPLTFLHFPLDKSRDLC